VGEETEVLHLIHSLDSQTGGVLSAVLLLNDTLNRLEVNSRISDDPTITPRNEKEWIIAHGLWQWPGRRAQQLKNRYLVYPHGMLDPWFKKAYPLKHFKKQIYWWFKQGRILRDAHGVCFTTEEERLLGQKTFFPYQAREIVTGLGVDAAPGKSDDQIETFQSQFPQLKGKKYLLYLGRFHPKKGVDDLIRAWKNRTHKEQTMLVLAGPLEERDRWIQSLQNLAGEDSSILWTGMLEGDRKWGALRLANALILPSHQENYGMVVAEACSVGLPVYLTDKVNLWREVMEAGAGVVENDTSAGIQNLVNQWTVAGDDNLKDRALLCFKKRLHIEQAANLLLREMKESAV
jgi:glycosyltransferase involved in cell wall biosynthesis